MKSHIDNYVNIQLLKEQLRRFGIIGIAAMLIYFLGVLLPLLNAASRAGQDAERLIVMILSMSHPIILIWMVLAPFCVVMALYPYHFSERATTAFYTFPVTKRQLFWTNFTAGTTLMIVPLFIMCLFLLIPIFRTQWPDYTIDAFGSMSRSWRSNVWLPPTIFPDGLEHGQVVNSAWRVMTFFGRNVVGLMFFFGVFLLAVSLAGSRLVSILLCATLPFVPLGVHGLIFGMSSLYLFGVHGAMGDFNQIAGYTIPVAAWHEVINGNAAHDIGIWVHSVVYITIAAAVVALAYLCSCMRKHERTGESVVFNKFKNIMVFALSIAGMVAMGAFMAALFGGRVWWYIGFVLGFTLMFIIAQMIMEKTFDIRHKIKQLVPFGGIMVGGYVVLVLIMTFGMAPYVNRVPDRANVAAVAVREHRGWRNTGSFVSDPAIIARVTELHQEILNTRAYLRQARNNNRFNNASWNRTSPFPITYRMHDGSYIRRVYHLTENFASRIGAYELSGDPAFILAAHRGLQNPQDVHYISIEFWDHHAIDSTTGFVNVIVTSPEEIQRLINVIFVEYQAHLGGGNVRLIPRREIWMNVRIELDPNTEGLASWETTDIINFNSCLDGRVANLLREFGYID